MYAKIASAAGGLSFAYSLFFVCVCWIFAYSLSLFLVRFLANYHFHWRCALKLFSAAPISPIQTFNKMYDFYANANTTCEWVGDRAHIRFGIDQVSAFFYTHIRIFITPFNNILNAIFCVWSFWVVVFCVVSVCLTIRSYAIGGFVFFCCCVNFRSSFCIFTFHLTVCECCSKRFCWLIFYSAFFFKLNCVNILFCYFALLLRRFSCFSCVIFVEYNYCVEWNEQHKEQKKWHKLSLTHDFTPSKDRHAVRCWIDFSCVFVHFWSPSIRISFRACVGCRFYRHICPLCIIAVAG